MARQTKAQAAQAAQQAAQSVDAIRHTAIAAYFAAIDEAKSAEKGFEQAKDRCSKLAFELLSPAKDHIEFFAIRDMLKADYIAARNPANDDEKTKATNAANMLWSRTVARASSMGYKAPEVPQSDEAKAKQAKREANKTAKGKAAYDAAIASGATPEVAAKLQSLAVDGRKAKAAINEANKPQNTPDDLSDDAIIAARGLDAQDNDGELFDAVDWVLQSATHVAQFITWAKTQQANTRTVRKVA